MKNTPLHDKHLALGARMAEFAGYDMPISYSNIKDEHHCVRNNVGVFDVSHMGEFIVKGKEALDLIQQAGGQVVGSTFFIELSFLGGRQRVSGTGPVHALITY